MTWKDADALRGAQAFVEGSVSRRGRGLREGAEHDAVSNGRLVPPPPRQTAVIGLPSVKRNKELFPLSTRWSPTVSLATTIRQKMLISAARIASSGSRSQRLRSVRPTFDFGQTLRPACSISGVHCGPRTSCSVRAIIRRNAINSSRGVAIVSVDVTSHSSCGIFHSALSANSHYCLDRQSPASTPLTSFARCPRFGTSPAFPECLSELTIVHIPPTEYCTMTIPCFGTFCETIEAFYCTYQRSLSLLTVSSTKIKQLFSYDFDVLALILCLFHGTLNPIRNRGT